MMIPITEPIGDLIRGWAGICAEVHRSKTQLWRDMRAGRFPAPLQIGENSVAWVRSEVDAWKASRPRSNYLPLPTGEPEARRRRRLTWAARELYFLIGRCPELFKHVLGPVSTDDMDTLREIAFADEEDDHHAAD